MKCILLITSTPVLHLLINDDSDEININILNRLITEICNYKLIPYHECFLAKTESSNPAT